MSLNIKAVLKALSVRLVYGLSVNIKSWDAIYNREHPPGFRWLHESFGTNWRMTEMQAAIGRIHLARMKSWTKYRQDNSK